jgi:hypothetical protein
MQPHSVKFGVTPCMRIECKFWIEDDGWNATIESLGLTVHAPSFEAAKNDMELTLGKHIESLLGERSRACCLKPLSVGGSSGTFRKQFVSVHSRLRFSRVENQVLSGAELAGFLEQAGNTLVEPVRHEHTQVNPAVEGDF